VFKYDVALNLGAGAADLGSAVEKLGGAFAQEIPQGELQLHELIWILPNGRGTVRYVYDHFVDVATVRAESPKALEPGEIVFDLSKHIAVYDVDALLKLANDPNSGTRAYAISALAVITPEFRGDVFKAICAALESPEPSMRWVAMKSIARWPWFKFAARLRAHAEKEQDEALRAEAVRLAADIVAHGKRGTL
jgi:hypothetical protein